MMPTSLLQTLSITPYASLTLITKSVLLQQEISSKSEFQLNLVTNFRRGLVLGPLEKTSIEEPRGICLDHRGNIYVSTKSAIIKIDLEVSESKFIAGDFKQFGFKDGKANQGSLFDHPDGIVHMQESSDDAKKN